MFDDQHNRQASVGSNVLLRKPARMSVAFSATAGILSAPAPLLTRKLLSENREVSERQDLVHKCACPILECPEPESGSFRISVDRARAYLWSRVEPSPLRGRRVRLHHSEDIRTEKSNVAQFRISDRRVVSPSAGSFLRENVGWARWWRDLLGGHSL